MTKHVTKRLAILVMDHSVIKILIHGRRHSLTGFKDIERHKTLVTVMLRLSALLE